MRRRSRSSTPASRSSSATSSARSSLVKSNAGSQLDLDNSGTALVTAQAQLQLVRHAELDALNQLLGNPDLPLEQFPAYMQAKAALDDAQRNLDLTTVCARR